MYKHVVMWKFNSNTSYFDKEKMVNILNDLANKIEFINKIEVSLNSSHSVSSYDIILITEFDSENEYKKYVNHPLHIKAVDFIKGIVIEKAIVDYNFNLGNDE